MLRNNSNCQKCESSNDQSKTFLKHSFNDQDLLYISRIKGCKPEHISDRGAAEARVTGRKHREAPKIMPEAGEWTAFLFSSSH